MSAPSDPLVERITLDPRSMTGKPVVRGTRLTVQFILGLLAHGSSASEILEEHEGLTDEDIKACLLFAAESVGRSLFVPLVIERA